MKSLITLCKLVPTELLIPVEARTFEVKVVLSVCGFTFLTSTQGSEVLKVSARSSTVVPQLSWGKCLRTTQIQSCQLAMLDTLPRWRTSLLSNGDVKENSRPRVIHDD